MNTIVLLNLERDNQRIQYHYQVSEELKQYFSEKAFVIDYPENIDSVPDAIVAVPFVCNVLPMVWLTDAKLVVPELDEAFYHCINEVKKGYEDMYPECTLRGEIEVGKIVPCDRPAIPGKCAMFYSGGVDSMEMLYRHVEEQPALVSIWGSDVRYDNEDGWKLLYTALEEAAAQYDLTIASIRSRFRDFDNESALNRAFGKQLQRNYWYGIKHALGLLGHVAVYAYLHQLSRFYIASSNCPADGAIRCASDPRTDNHVRFAGCQVVHDGFELTRQDKLRNIVQYRERTGQRLPLHVCWETQTGKNCCKCEKCYRTMTGLILENADPLDYGFPDAAKELPYMREKMVFGGNSAPKTWSRLHADAAARKHQMRGNPYWKYVKWVADADFLTPGALKMPLSWRIRTGLSRFYLYRCAGRLVKKILKR